MSKKIIVIGIDGTLSNNTGRRTDGTWSENEDDFVNDPVNEEVGNIVANLCQDYWLIGITGITVKKRKMVMDWLVSNNLDFIDRIHMRPENDYRKEAELKVSMVKELYIGHQVVAVLDNRDDVIEAFRAAGITAFQYYSPERIKKEVAERRAEDDGREGEEAAGEA